MSCHESITRRQETYDAERYAGRRARVRAGRSHLPVDRAHEPMLLDIDGSTAITTTTTTDPTFDAGKNQAVVVGSGVVTTTPWMTIFDRETRT